MPLPSATPNRAVLPRGAGLLLPADGGSLALNSCHWLDFTTPRRLTARTAEPSSVCSSPRFRTSPPARRSHVYVFLSKVWMGRPRPRPPTSAGPAHKAGPAHTGRLHPRPPSRRPSVRCCFSRRAVRSWIPVWLLTDAFLPEFAAHPPCVPVQM